MGLCSTHRPTGTRACGAKAGVVDGWVVELVVGLKT